MGISTRYLLSAFAAMLLFFSSCSKQDAAGDVTVSESAKPAASGNTLKAAAFAQGADIGWLSMFEGWGDKWLNASGVATDAIQLLKNKGVNSIRFRVLVNPPSTGKDASGYNMGWCDGASVLTMAKRAKALGMRVMLDLHYSDYWCDPSHQAVPAAWANDNLTQLCTHVYQHTTDMLKYFINNGVTPEWVQVGNEINGGICWPQGKINQASDMANTAKILLNGYNAVKAVSSSIKVVIHLANAQDNTLFRWYFDTYKSYGGKWDVIGMSSYPAYGSTIATLKTNLNDMASRYGCEVLVAETGYSETDATGSYNNLLNTVNAVKAVPSSKGIGVFYWEPVSHSALTSYSLGASTKVTSTTFKLTTALNAFGGQ